MEKYYKILYFLNQNSFQSQRALAKSVDMSIGLVNSSLKKMEKDGYVMKDGNTYILTEKARTFLEEMLEDSQVQRLSMEEEGREVKAAVILAAGDQPEGFDVPAGLLPIDGQPVIEHIIGMLMNAGIERFYVVVGYKKEQYEKHFENRNVVLIENPKYKWTGTMASVAAVKDKVKEDFLLVDSNQIFEETAITALMSNPHNNCILLVNPSGSQKEGYVELNDDGTLFRVTKDIHQLNRIDAEMTGISKISYPLYKKMMEYYKGNQNPMLSYEYVIENVGRIYKIYGDIADDIAWTVIENEALYKKAVERIFPRIKKRAILRRENNAKEILKECMDLKEEEIEDFKLSGGMTNTNFYVKFHGKEYILRIPGACTEVMIDRKSERHNSALASSIGINPAILYFNAETGVKITEFIREAETLNGKTARLEMNIAETTAILKYLHESEMKMYNDFSVQREYEKYKKMLEEIHGVYYDGFQEMDQFFYHLMDRLVELGLERKPCHNDLVAENFIKDGSGKMYLIDWEYSGYNDPMWDLAAHLLECEFAPIEEELFLHYYFEEEMDEVRKEKILIFKMCQDILWSIWTMLKETKGEDFGSYGKDRLNRAIQMREEYVKQYESGK